MRTLPAILQFATLGNLAPDGAWGTEPPPDRHPSIPNPAWLRETHVAVSKQHQLPAPGAALVIRERIVAASVIGVRK